MDSASDSVSLWPVYFTYPETRGVPLEAMSELFEDSPLDEQDEDANERVPLTRSRSNSRSRSPDATGRLSVEPPPLNDDLSKSDVLGRLFGQEVRAGSSRKNSFAAEQREDDEDIPRVSAAAGERRGGYQAVAVDDRD